MINSIDININGRSLEGIAGETIYPGYLVERRLDDLIIQPHSTLAGRTVPLVAIENKIANKDLYDPYEPGDTVYMRYCLPGDVFLGFFDGMSAPVGVFLQSYGNGKLMAATPDPADRVLVGILLTEPALDPKIPAHWIRVEVA